MNIIGALSGLFVGKEEIVLFCKCGVAGKTGLATQKLKDIVHDVSNFTCIVMATFSFLSGIASRSLEAHTAPCCE